MLTRNGLERLLMCKIACDSFLSIEIYEELMNILRLIDNVKGLNFLDKVAVVSFIHVITVF